MKQIRENKQIGKLLITIQDNEINMKEVLRRLGEKFYVMMEITFLLQNKEQS